VLDHALSAVLGAIWLDCEHQKRTTAEIRLTILEILRTIDAILDEHSSTAGCNTGSVQTQSHQRSTITDFSAAQPGTEDLAFEDSNDIDRFTREWFEQELDGLSVLPRSRRNSTPELRTFLGQAGSIASPDGHFIDDTSVSVSASSNEHRAACERSDVQLWPGISRYRSQGNEPHNAEREASYLSILQDTPGDVAIPAKGVKRKRSQDRGEKDGPLYQEMLHSERQKLMCVSQIDRERLTRFLEHPMLDELGRRASILSRFLYLTIGSWETIVDFRGLVRLARSASSVRRQPSLSPRNAAETYDEICRLEKEGALSILLRRYHTVKLCEEEHLYNDHHSHIIVETPSTVGVAKAVKPGNPVLALDSSLTEKLLLKIMPNTDPGSNEFQKARVKVKRLRKLAGCLRILVKSYGFGILGLLPSGPSFEQMSLTDNM
jgi:hypothetical protein